MMKVIKYTVEIYDGSGIIGRGKPLQEFKEEEFNVIAENKMNIVIDDLSFTTLRKTKCDYSTCLDVPSIGFSNNDNVWGNSIRYHLFSSSPINHKKIKTFIEKETSKRFGFFTGKLDLSFIK